MLLARSVSSETSTMDGGGTDAGGAGASSVGSAHTGSCGRRSPTVRRTDLEAQRHRAPADGGQRHALVEPSPVLGTARRIERAAIHLHVALRAARFDAELHGAESRCHAGSSIADREREDERPPGSAAGGR
jgi:hypothetical protein